MNLKHSANVIAGMGGTKDVYRLLAQRTGTPEAADAADRFIRLVTGRRAELVRAADEDRERLERSSSHDSAVLSPDEACVVAGAVARHIAPLALVDGCWLEPFLMAPLCHCGPGAVLATEHRSYCRPDKPDTGRGRGIIRLLQQLTIPLGPPSSIEFHRRIAISTEAYELPAFLLALAGSPMEYLTELVCAEFAGRDGEFFRLPAWIEKAVDTTAAELDLPAALLNDVRQSGRHKVTAEPKDLLSRFAERGLPASADQRQRDANDLLAALRDRLRGLIDKRCTDLLRNPAAGVAALMMSKASSARYAHGARHLSGRRLDELFEAMPAEPLAVVDALARSRWIQPGNPEKSRFVNELTDPAVGPMGKIFSCEELALIRIWIRSLKPAEKSAFAPVGHRPTGGPEVLLPPEHVGAYLPVDSFPSTMMPVPDARTVYYQLLSGKERPAALRGAKAFALSWLSVPPDKYVARSAWIPPEHYDRDEFCDWFARSYLTMASANTAQTPDLGVLHPQNVLQGAPDNLVDGAWLQRITRDGLDNDVQRLLYEIYWDEIGRGDTTKSHSNIYLNLLRSLGFQLPHCWSREFAFSELFVDEAFYVPAFRLAISEFPRTLLPEIVGVNLVSEFHGLGSNALDRVDELQSLGFDPTFSRIHIADDNVELGHSAKARDAVLFLLDHADRLDAAEMTWTRVLSGITAMRMAYAALGERLRADRSEGPESNTRAAGSG